MSLCDGLVQLLGSATPPCVVSDSVCTADVVASAERLWSIYYGLQCLLQPLGV